MHIYIRLPTQKKKIYNMAIPKDVSLVTSDNILHNEVDILVSFCTTNTPEDKIKIPSLKLVYTPPFK